VRKKTKKEGINHLANKQKTNKIYYEGGKRNLFEETCKGFLKKIVAYSTH